VVVVAALLAADFGFWAAVGSGDLDTVRSALDNHGERIGATVTSPAGHPMDV